MRIACLQFAPQVGDIDNNLNRADSVLAKANPDDLEDLDLLVLPELAFTGYNFKSLNQISPFLEPQGSGISALWARTTALKYNTNVMVGYPERVDVSAKWPTGPEYYNSTLVINGDGETIANYRKSFLYVIDETWALEGKDGFFDEEIPELGNVAMGICMDLNPYKFEAPWHAFEFAFHVLAVEANLVVVTMAWVTREDGRHFSRMPEEPDMETLTYWVQRLEPLIRAERRDEVIVVFCNRIGMEDDLVYAGTSSVIGIKNGEVNVYGILGRSVKDLLVVDTGNEPFAKLVQRSEEPEIDTVSQVSGMSRKPWKAVAATPALSSSPANPTPKTKTRQRKPSPTPGPSAHTRKIKPQSPRIQIPESNFYRHQPSRDSPVEESPSIETPTCPSPTPFDQRPKVISPSPALNSLEHHIDTPYPRDETEQQGPQVLGGRVSMDQQGPSVASPGSVCMPDKYFGRATQPPLRSPMESRFPHVYPPASPSMVAPVASALINFHLKDKRGPRSHFNSNRQSQTDDAIHPTHADRAISRQDQTMDEESSEGRDQDVVPPRPSSPKSRNASRTGRQGDRRPSDLNQADLSGLGDRLESMMRRPGSAMDSRSNAAGDVRHDRARSRESRSVRPGGTPQTFDERSGNVSDTEISFMASHEILSETIIRPQSDILKSRAQALSRNAERQMTTSPRPLGLDNPRAKSSMGQICSRAGSMTNLHKNSKPHIEPDESRTLLWSELSKMVGEVLHQPTSRDVSRGRQQHAQRPVASRLPTTSRPARAESHGGRALPAADESFASRERRESTDHQSIRTILAPDAAQGQVPSYDPDDEIVAEIIFHSHGRQNHNQTDTPGQPTKSRSPPSTQRGVSRQNSVKNTHLNRRPREATPQTRRQLSSPQISTNGRRSVQDGFGEIKVYKAPTPLSKQTRRDSGNSCPTLDGASVHTITTPSCSPLTPAARIFEPKTPKAMTLGPDYGILSSVSDPHTHGAFPPLDAMENELAAAEIVRAKSTLW